MAAQSKPPQVVIKMSATRELLPDANHVGGPAGGNSDGVIVEMAPQPVTIVISETPNSTANKERGGNATPAKSE